MHCNVTFSSALVDRKDEIGGVVQNTFFKSVSRLQTTLPTLTHTHTQNNSSNTHTHAHKQQQQQKTFHTNTHT